MSSGKFVKKYSMAASVGFLTGLVLSMTGLLLAMVSKLSRLSGSDVILTVSLLLGAGVIFILASINLAGLRKSFLRNYSFLAGVILSVAGLSSFASWFPEGWFYPHVSYVIVFYSAGVFLLLINIFVNYFLDFPEVEDRYQGVSSSNSSAGSSDDCYGECSSVLATFAGILMTNFASGHHEPLAVTGTGANGNGFIISETTYEEKQPEPYIMETAEQNRDSDINDSNVQVQTDVCENNFPEPPVPQASRFPEIAEIEEREEKSSLEDICNEECLSPGSLSAGNKPVVAETSFAVPFSEFMYMKQTDIKANDSMREAACKLLSFHFGEMIAHERGTKIGRDIEELHDMRVAAMRMRSVVEVLENYLDMNKISSHYRDIKSTRKVLGSVRDLDVFLEKIDNYLENQPPEMRAGIDPLADSILIERAKHRGEMLVYLDDEKYNKFKHNFSDYLLSKKAWKTKSVTRQGEPVAHRVADVLPVLLYSQFAAVRAYADVISTEEIDPYQEKYHRLRIDVKILRYTLEFFKEVLGSQSRSLIKDLKDLQDNLGDMHDTVVALQLLENFEKYGRWGETGKNRISDGARMQDYPGVDKYIEHRKKELHNLAVSFPEMWSKVNDPDFSIRFSEAIAGIYNS